MNNSLIGVTAEMVFRSECLKRKIIASVPDADTKGYDVVTHFNKKLFKVQVKCTNHKVRSGYKVSCGRGSKGKNLYTKNDIDFFAIYIIERDDWCIVPISEINTVTITLFPDNPKHRFYKYFSAWYLLAS